MVLRLMGGKYSERKLASVPYDAVGGRPRKLPLSEDEIVLYCGRVGITRDELISHIEHNTVPNTLMDRRTKHPLYTRWRNIVYQDTVTVCLRWRLDFRWFCEDVGIGQGRLVRIDKGQGWGADNFKWER